MLLNELLDLRGDLGAIETHHEQLTHGPGSLRSVTMPFRGPGPHTDLSISSQALEGAILTGAVQPLIPVQRSILTRKIKALLELQQLVLRPVVYSRSKIQSPCMENCH